MTTQSHASGVQSLLKETAVLKLNGGLGTSMGLEKAKSLLEVSITACESMDVGGVTGA